MNQIIVKIPRKKQKVRIIKSEEIIRREFGRKVKELEEKFLKEIEEMKVLEEPEPIEEIIVEPEPVGPKRTYFTEVFTISDSNQPIEISLSNIPDETVTIDEAAYQIQKAYDKGMQDGQDSARAIYESEILVHSEWIKRFDNIAFTLKKLFLGEIRKFEDSLVELSSMIAERIVEQKADESNDVIFKQLRKAFEEVGDDDIFKITLNEDDFDVLTGVDSDLFKEFPELEKVKIEKSANIERGGCILNTSAGTIDARIETQLGRLKESLFNLQKQRQVRREKTISEDYPEILDNILPNISPEPFISPDDDSFNDDSTFDFDDFGEGNQ